MLLQPTGNHKSNPSTGHQVQNTPPRPLAPPAAPSPHLHYVEFYSKVGPRPTSSALSQESGKSTQFRLIFPHRSPLPLLYTWPYPKIPRKPPSPGPPPQPSPGSSPLEVTQNPQSLTGEALCQPLSPVPAGALQRIEGASRTAQEARRVPPPARGGYAPSSRQSCCCRPYP